MTGAKTLRRLGARARRLLADARGSMAIETAIVAPVLITLALGGIEVSSVVARQTELQSAAAEAAALVRAVPPASSVERTQIRDIVADSAKLSTSQVSVITLYRCNGNSGYVLSRGNCDEERYTSKYIRVTLTSRYVPMWTQFGIGSAFSLNVQRTILVG